MRKSCIQRLELFFLPFCSWKTKNYYLNISPFSPFIVFLSGPTGYKIILMIISKFKLLTDGMEITDLTRRRRNVKVYLHLWCGALQRRRPCAQRWPCPDCAEARNLLGSLHLPLLFPDTSEHRRLRREERDGWREEGEKRLLSPFHLYSPPTPVDLSPLCPSRPPVPPSFLTPPCLFAGTPALRLFFLSLPLFLSLSLSPSLSFSPILRGGQKVEERRDGEKVRWLGWAREENEQQNRGIKEIDGLFFCRGCP